MTGALLVFAIWWVPVVVLAVVLNAKSRRPVFWGWLILALLVHAAYTAASWLAAWALPPGAAPETHWPGSLAGLAVGAGLTQLMLRRHRRLMPWELGLTLRQAPGSWLFSLGGILLLTLLGTLADGIKPAQAAPSLPALAYHLTLPGLEQELMYRGLLLSLFTASLAKRPAVPLWATVMTNLLFALAHGIFWQDGRIGFNLVTIALTGVAGVVLTAMRLKSGSLLPGVIGLNLFGLAARFA